MCTKPRLATPNDLQAVQDIVRAAYSPYESVIGRKPGPMLDDYDVLIQDGRVSVVEVEGIVQGIVVLIPEEKTMLLDNIAVSPLAQGSGLGRQLIQHAESYANSIGYQLIRLYTHELMTRNIEYYSRIGYQETHRAEEKGLKRVYMTKTLG
ncbi:acyl-CoA N-acyltransferase [Xylariaceae sp. FL1272]|nr:acyl-CoA N-acyltransferase [Xylariaceae sp. FL1272]